MKKAGEFARRRGWMARRQFLSRHRVLLARLIASYIAGAGVLLAIPLALPRSFRLGAVIVGVGWLISYIVGQDGSRRFFEGAEAESWSSSALRRLRRAGWRSLDGIAFESFDVDHVAVGPGGVYAIETKRTSFPWSLTKDGIMGPVNDPLGQATQGARSVRLLLRSYGIFVEVRPALILWGPGAPNVEGRLIRRGVFILSGRTSREWRTVLSAPKRPLDLETIERIDRALRDFVARRDQYQRSLQAG